MQEFYLINSCYTWKMRVFKIPLLTDISWLTEANLLLCLHFHEHYSTWFRLHKTQKCKLNFWNTFFRQKYLYPFYHHYCSMTSEEKHAHVILFRCSVLSEHVTVCIGWLCEQNDVFLRKINAHYIETIWILFMKSLYICGKDIKCAELFSQVKLVRLMSFFALKNQKLYKIRI